METDHDFVIFELYLFDILATEQHFLGEQDFHQNLLMLNKTYCFCAYFFVFYAPNTAYGTTKYTKLDGPM